MGRRRRGNPRALMKAVQRNPRMTPSAKRKALSTLQRQVSGSSNRSKQVRVQVQRYQPYRPKTRSETWEGVRLIAEGSASIASEPVRKAFDIYRIVKGANKIRNARNRKRR